MRDSSSLQMVAPVASLQRAEFAALKHSVRGRLRSQPQLVRKVYHLGMGLACFALYGFILNRTGALIALATIGGSLVLMDVLRFKIPAMNLIALRVYGKLMRSNELHGLTGNTYYVIGLFLITLLFPQPIVLLSVLFLAVGDSVASIVGTRWGKVRPAWMCGKSVEGALANAFASAIVAFAFATGYLHLNTNEALMLTAVGAFASMLAEALPIPLDDNFTIPVVSSIVLALFTSLVPLF